MVAKEIGWRNDWALSWFHGIETALGLKCRHHEGTWSGASRARRLTDSEGG
jgi:hypothetical protein